MFTNIKKLVAAALSVAGLAIVQPILAQSGANPGAIGKLSVASPTASGLAQFTDFPTSSYSGTPDISIPLYSIKTSFTEVPLVLSYHGSGIRVNQNSGSIGLGWNIVASGVITRSILGLPDDGSWQSNGGINWVSQPIDFHNDTVYKQTIALANNQIDGAPDLYTYNMGGYSGKFIIADSVRQLPQTNCLITRISANEFQIVAPTGIKYIFDVPETSFNKSASAGSTNTVAWYLSKIIAADKTDSVLFTYKNTGYEMDAGRNFSVEILQNSAGMYNAGSSSNASYINRINGKELSRIDFKQGSVEFNLTWNNRQDLSNVDSAASVNAIVIKNKQGVTLRSISFLYDYFTNGDTGADNKRLRLTGAYFLPGGSTDTSLAERYNFIYNSTPLPAKNSLSIDHWGYYNGAFNTTLIPTWTNCVNQYVPPNCSYCSQNTFAFTYSGANRESHATYCKAGMLERINLPTGGYRQYEWEPNDVPNPDANKPYYTNSQLEIAFVEGNSTGSAFVTDSSADFYVDPATFPNGICARISGDMSPGSEDPSAITHSASSVKLYRRSGRSLVQGFSLTTGAGFSQSSAVVLEAGQTYFMVVQTRGPGFTVSSDLSGYTISGYPPKNKIVGGVRLKRLTMYDQVTNTNIANRYEYVIPGSNNLSSGELAHRPSYEVPITTFKLIAACTYSTLNGVRLSSNSIYNIGAGSHVGYAYVREIREPGNGMGSTLYEYANDFGESFSGEFDASWRRGLLLSKTAYDSAGRIQNRLYNHYTYDQRGFKHYAGRQVVGYYAHPCASTTIYNEDAPIYATFKGYYYPSDWIYVDSSSTTMYDRLSNVISITTSQKFRYDNPKHKMLSRASTWDSKGGKTETYTKYPFDYVLPTGTLTGELQAIQDLQSKNRNEVIEEYGEKNNVSNSATVSGMYNTYKTISSAAGSQSVPDVQFKLAPGDQLSNFAPSTVTGTSIVKDPRYLLNAKITSYDGNLNIAQVEKTGNYNTAYLWDYNGSYLVAEFKNAAQSEVAFSSFEADGKGNWSYTGAHIADATAMTGKNSYNLASGAISKSGLTAATSYVVSYWTKNTSAYTITGTAAGYPLRGTTVNGWTYFQHKLTGVTSITIIGTGQIDELRLHPATSLGTTYTYEPLVGVTSSCDESNKIAYYTYDGAGRLIQIKDQYGKILKLINYQYQALVTQ